MEYKGVLQAKENAKSFKKLGYVIYGYQPLG
jgi:hypothetical protein